MAIHHRRGRNVWHSDGRPAGYPYPQRRRRTFGEHLSAFIGCFALGGCVAAILWVLW